MEKLQQQIGSLKLSLQEKERECKELIEQVNCLQAAMGRQTDRHFEEKQKLIVEQQIVGIERLVEEFAVKPHRECALHELFELTPSQAYDFCDVIYGGDSQHVRGKHGGV